MKKPTSTITSEKTFKRWIRWMLEEQGFHTTEHEDKFGVGIPDVSYGASGINGWIEFKWRQGVLRPAQINWLDNRAYSGGHCFVCRGFPEKLEIIDWALHHQSILARPQWPSDLPPFLLAHQEIPTGDRRLHLPLGSQYRE